MNMNTDKKNRNTQRRQINGRLIGMWVLAQPGKTFEYYSMGIFLSARVLLSRMLTLCVLRRLWMYYLLSCSSHSCKCCTNRSYPGQLAGIFIIMGHVQYQFAVVFKIEKASRPETNSYITLSIAPQPLPIACRYCAFREYVNYILIRLASPTSHRFSRALTDVVLHPLKMVCFPSATVIIICRNDVSWMLHR